jgi:cytosine/uracil/thiamine/allantoin permease
MGLRHERMKFFQECKKRPWAFLIVIFVAAVSSFVTWLALASAGVSPQVNKWWSAGAFVGVSIILLTYVISCMRRHCSDFGLHD